jgi:hypothetical protein
VISAVAGSLATTSGASIGWITNEATDTQVEYGLSTAYGSSTALNGALATVHTQSLTGLSAATVCHYRVKSRDAAGNLAMSGDFAFNTSAPSASAPAITGNYTDLWWNAAESGGGVNVDHQGNVVFATLFTHDADGTAMWLVTSDGRKQADGSYLGALYRTTGPEFNAQQWSANAFKAVGTRRSLSPALVPPS